MAAVAARPVARRTGPAVQDLELQVADDGRGPEATTNGHGHGLVGIRERVKLYGGELSSGPAPGGGFRLTTSLPLSGYGS